MSALAFTQRREKQGIYLNEKNGRERHKDIDDGDSDRHIRAEVGE